MQDDREARARRVVVRWLGIGAVIVLALVGLYAWWARSFVEGIAQFGQ